MKNRKLIIVILFFFILIMGIFIISIKNNTSVNKSGSNEDVKPFTIRESNESIPEDIIASSIKNIKMYLADDNLKTANTTGFVRKNSVVIDDKNNSLNTSFIVDIPDLKRSYRIQHTIDYESGYNALLVICPKDDEIIYGKFECKDDVSG